MQQPQKQHYPRIGEVYSVYFTGSGSEQSGWRPGVVFQNNVGNKNSPNIIVLPITSSLKKLNMPTHVLVKSEDTGLFVDSMVICENPERMSKTKLGKFITKLSDEYMSKIAEASLLATSAIAYLDEESLLRAWRKSRQLNAVTA